MRIILASASKRRKYLMGLLGIEFEVLPSRVKEEIDDTRKDYENVVKELALKKAMEVFDRTFEDRVVVGADTIVVKDGKIYGKPRDVEEARRFLKELSGNKHVVYTGVAVVSMEGETVFCEKTTVWFRKLPDDLIDLYIERFHPLDKAGAYGIQDLGAIFVEKIEGDFYTVMGLPIGRLWKVFYEKGWWG